MWRKGEASGLLDAAPGIFGRNERHLRRVLSSYGDYYHRTRTHLARQGLPRRAPDPAAQDRKNRRHPANRRPASSLRTSRRLIRPRFPHTDGCVVASPQSSEDVCIGGPSISITSRPFVVRIAARFHRIKSISILAAAQIAVPMEFSEGTTTKIQSSIPTRSTWAGGFVLIGAGSCDLSRRLRG